MSETKLKPCPFCGSEIGICYAYDVNGTKVFILRHETNDCILKEFQKCSAMEGLLDKKWNRRVA